MDFGRRRLLAALGSAGVVTVAGCSSGDGPTDEPSATVTETVTEAETAPTTPTPASTPATEPAPTPTAGATVGMSCQGGDDGDEYFFSPGVVWVEPGTEVSWSPTSSCRQRALSYHPENDLPRRVPEGADPWASDVLQGSMGGTFTHQFDIVGVHNYAGLHAEFGQVGIVVVGRPERLESEPGMQEPGDEIEPAAAEQLRVYIEQVRELLGEE